MTKSPTPTIEGVAFDLEGTIIDTEAIHKEGYKKIVEELRLPIKFEEIWTTWIGVGNDKISADISRLSDNKITPEQVTQNKADHYTRALSDHKIAPRPGFLELHKKVISRQLPVAIGSLTTTSWATHLIEKSGIDKVFPKANIVLREDVELIKPAPDVFIETAHRMNIPPEQQIVFEDSQVGVEAAITAGSKAYAIPTPSNATEQSISLLSQAGATEVFLNWKDIPESIFL